MDREKLEIWTEERVEKLKEGDFVATPGGDIAKAEIPEWYDEVLFNKAKAVYKEYFASVNFSHLCGLLLSFYFPKNIRTLRSTGESETTLNLFRRYLTTTRYVQKWYEGDVWDPQDPAHKTLAQVRAMHARVAKRMANTTDDGVVYVSQWDMAVTQWAFVGPMVLFRSKVGLHSCTDEQFEALMHFWRVIGYLLGIEDQYNLCTGDYDQVLEACQYILEKEYRTRMVAADPSSVAMCRSVVEAMALIDPALTWPSMCRYIHELAGLPVPEVLSYSDWISHWMSRFIMTFVLQFEVPRSLFNEYYKWRLHLADKKDRELREAKKYYVLPAKEKDV